MTLHRRKQPADLNHDLVNYSSTSNRCRIRYTLTFVCRYPDRARFPDFGEPFFHRPRETFEGLINYYCSSLPFLAPSCLINETFGSTHVFAVPKTKWDKRGEMVQENAAFCPQKEHCSTPIPTCFSRRLFCSLFWTELGRKRKEGGMRSNVIHHEG